MLERPRLGGKRTPAPDERQRSFAEFLSGRVDILTGTVTGKEVVLQMLFPHGRTRHDGRYHRPRLARRLIA